jgi:hypothetical protein
MRQALAAVITATFLGLATLVGVLVRDATAGRSAGTVIERTFMCTTGPFAGLKGILASASLGTAEGALILDVAVRRNPMPGVVAFTTVIAGLAPHKLPERDGPPRSLTTNRAF